VPVSPAACGRVSPIPARYPGLGDGALRGRGNRVRALSGFSAPFRKPRALSRRTPPARLGRSRPPKPTCFVPNQALSPGDGTSTAQVRLAFFGRHTPPFADLGQPASECHRRVQLARKLQPGLATRPKRGSILEPGTKPGNRLRGRGWSTRLPTVPDGSTTTTHDIPGNPPAPARPVLPPRWLRLTRAPGDRHHRLYDSARRRPPLDRDPAPPALPGLPPHVPRIRAVSSPSPDVLPCRARCPRLSVATGHLSTSLRPGVTFPPRSWDPATRSPPFLPLRAISGPGNSDRPEVHDSAGR